MGSFSGGGGGSNKVEASPLEIENAEISREKWDRYKGSFREKVESKFRERVNAMGVEGASNAAASMAEVSLSNKFRDHAKSTIASEMQNSGVSARSGRMIGLRAKTQRMGAGMNTASKGRARSGQKDRHYGGKMNGLSIGQGQAVSAQNSMMGLVDDAVKEQQQKAIAKWNDSNMLQTTAVQTGTLGAMYFKRKG